MNIRPYSESAFYSAGGKYEPIAANFPALKHFFKCEEATAATTLTDSIEGVTIPVAGGVTQKVAGASIIMANLINVEITGTWATLSGTGVLVAVFDADVTGATLVEVNVGGNPGANNYFGITGAGGGVSGFGEGATVELTTTQAQVTEGVVALRATPGTGCDIWNGSTTATTKGTGGSTGTPAAWPTLTNEFKLTSLEGTGGGNGLYGFALFDFTTAPSDADIANAISWMNAQWLQGNKWIYPGWAGRS